MHQASFKTFGKLISGLDQCNATKTKINLISEFIKNIDPRDGSWILVLLMGNQKKRLITGRRLREILQSHSKIPTWLFDDCFAQVGDSAETISLLWPQVKHEHILDNHKLSEDLELAFSELKDSNCMQWWMETLLPKLKDLKDTSQKNAILRLWSSIPDADLYLINKLITGGFRIGVSKGIVVKSIAQSYGLDESTILERLMVTMEPDEKWFKTLTQPEDEKRTNRGAIPYPFYLASPVQIENIRETPATDWRLEYKWDGIRGQLIKRGSGAFLWSRGEELVNHVFPEIITMAEYLPKGTVLDGEILCWNQEADKPMPFASLQRRLGHKTVSKRLLKELPVVFMAYDIIESEQKDYRTYKLENRVKTLEKLYERHKHKCLLFRYNKQFTNWDELEKIRENAGQDGAEGLMIKKKDSCYLSGRKRGYWWKYKHEPMTLDAVLIYAQAGTGKRANLFTDYTFALWNDSNQISDERKLVSFAKAYSGLNNLELETLNRWIRINTIERFGPTRVVEQKQVFEIAFEGVMESKRHKCGLAVRFPRIHRWRIDKLATDADCIDQAHELLKKT
jgi:DNA ligase-1